MVIPEGGVNVRWREKLVLLMVRIVMPLTRASLLPIAAVLLIIDNLWLSLLHPFSRSAVVYGSGGH